MVSDSICKRKKHRYFFCVIVEKLHTYPTILSEYYKNKINGNNSVYRSLIVYCSSKYLF